MAQLWEVVMVAVCMVIIGHGMPMDDTAETAKESLVTAEQHNTKTKQDTHSNPPQPHGPSITEITNQLLTSSVKYPDNAKMIPFARSTGQECNKIGSLPNPLECQYFTFCIEEFQGSKEFIPTLNICDHGHYFNTWEKNCIKGECIEVNIGPALNDPPPPPPPSPSLNEIPSWLINAPEWFEEKPWWFEMAPPWYHTPPAWLKPNVLTEQIQVEAGPGLEVQKPDQIIKNVGVPIQSSPDEKDAPVYHDNKTLR
ncbi:uncharacterized protein LOC123518563 isoform X2 [Portunus trituberculatus]|nr:uncharacterized protein LOC123518563 isoform X2 [Portunus trituberculatus]